MPDIDCKYISSMTVSFSSICNSILRVVDCVSYTSISDILSYSILFSTVQYI